MDEGQQPARASSTLHKRIDLDFALQAAELGVWEYDPDSGVVHWDTQSQALFGISKLNDTPYEHAIQFIHHDDQARVDQAVQRALDPQSDGRYDQTYRTIGIEDGQLRWVRFQGRAYFTSTGQLDRFGGICQEVTRQVLDQRALLVSEDRFKTLIEEAPVATSLFVGRELRVEVANAPMLAIWGKGPNQVGRTLADILPEIANQPFLAILDEVYTSGQTYAAKGGRADLVYDGVLGTYYFDFTYKPLLDANNQVYAILQMAVDVTQQVVAQQQSERARQQLKQAVDLAHLGIWHIDLRTQETSFSERMIAWAGGTHSLTLAQFIAAIEPADQPVFMAAYQQAQQPNSSGYLSVEYRLNNATTGQIRLVHLVGQTLFDEEGHAVSLSGFSQDISRERATQLDLERQVNQRTQELAVINQELTATNEEYTAINKELGEANRLLLQSNDNLQTFTYIASHDLQEPLRKIQQFGNLLQVRFTDLLDEEAINYLTRMQGAAGRMSTLIRDLLSFSRISTQRSIDTPVALGQVVGEVLEVMDLAISEAGAQIQVGTLPTILGDAVQLGQLFQNLLSNALKFRQPNTTSLVRISSQPVSIDALPTGLKPARQSAVYHCIQVADNGIGFEEKYLDRIFGVFQRLHGKGQYAGTGVGLAICEKVIANHGGAITAQSQPGQGATFVIYLPAEAN